MEHSDLNGHTVPDAVTAPMTGAAAGVCLTGWVWKGCRRELKWTTADSLGKEVGGGAHPNGEAMVRRRRSLITAVAELWRSVATLASSCSSVERRGVSRVQLFGKERRGAGRRLTEQGEKEVEADSNLTKSSELQRPDIAQRRRWRERKVAHSCG
jgi:hypothetical protein